MIFKKPNWICVLKHILFYWLFSNYLEPFHTHTLVSVVQFTERTPSLNNMCNHENFGVQL